MRLRRASLAIVVFLAALSTVASAQQPKKKKPKKPKTEQKVEPEPDTKNKEDEEPPLATTDPPDKAPPPLDTNLKEEGSTRVGGGTNPWVTSGIAKPKDGTQAPSYESSGTDSNGDHKKQSASGNSHPLAVTARGGYATENLRIGFGLGVGYSIADQFYVGGAFTYHLGTSLADTTVSVYYPALELGFDYKLEGVTIRPYSGIGGLWVRVSSPSVSSAGSVGPYLTIYPGLQIDYQIPSTPVFVGVDGRALFILSSEIKSGTSIGVFGVGGARF